MQLTNSDARQIRFPGWAAPAALVFLVFGSTVSCLGNSWVQDDLTLIRYAPLAHTLAQPWIHFTQSYWPAPYARDLYRPLTSLSFAVEWVLGGGHAVVFRIVSVLLYLGTTLALYRLAKRIVSPGAAWLAAALFAVHPVHVEAVAVAVNQAELIVGALLALLMTAYIDRRQGELQLSSRWTLAMTGGYLLALLFKEHAILLPALMVTAELTVIRDLRPWRQRMASLRRLFLWLLLVAVVFVGVRTLALHGNTKGSFTA
ncbi:MAG: glycosyltransferase family 39 protein, partial [Gemmatimonadales bacterium]